ncbi:STAS domain-containing protein [Streptomyces sp. NPDC057137]|uniref:STAS domain-containing protein n=1 Tax=Streptomyces sp. NPDC057137 TaxID=3346030 RepID=UPI003634A33F
MNALTVHIHAIPTGPVVVLTGDLDHQSAPHVRQALRGLDPRPGQQVVIDLAGLTFCDSTGITVLIAARNQALAADAGIALARVPERVARVFRVIGLEQAFPTHASVDEAAAAWLRAG